jgi:hypothetical protein
VSGKRVHLPGAAYCQQRVVYTLQLLRAKHGQRSATTRFRSLYLHRPGQPL